MSCIMTGGMSSSHVDYHSKLVMSKDAAATSQAATATNIMHAHRLTQKNIEFLSFDIAENEFYHENELYFMVSQDYFHNYKN